MGFVWNLTDDGGIGAPTIITRHKKDDIRLSIREHLVLKHNEFDTAKMFKQESAYREVRVLPAP